MHEKTKPLLPRSLRLKFFKYQTWIC